VVTRRRGGLDGRDGNDALKTITGEAARARRLVLAEDSDETRALLRAWFAADSRFLIAGEAQTLNDAVAIAIDVAADALLLDWSLPPGNGEVTDPQEAIHRLRTRCPGCRVVVVSGAIDADLGGRALAAGAHQALRKGLPLSRVTQAVLGSSPTRSPSSAPAPVRSSAPAAAPVTRPPDDDWYDRVLHDLRTPLMALQSYADVLPGLTSRGDVDAIGRASRGIRRNVVKLDLLVQMLMSDAALRADGLVLQPRRIDLGRIVAEVAEGLQPLLDDRPLTVDASTVMAEADEMRTRELISYLVMSAVRSGPTTIPIALRTRQRATDVGVVCSVAEPRPPRRGLELASAEALAHAQGGEVQVSARPDATVYEFVLPRPASSHPEGPTDPPSGDSQPTPRRP
jgi:DNA-binding NarL/FixJ family response regulator